jgi:2'-5' RNA ligase
MVPVAIGGPRRTVALAVSPAIVSGGTDGSSGIRLRLFVALNIPEAVKAEMAKAQSELKQVLSAGLVRWTRPEQFHLTLKFLGNVDGCQTTGLTEAVQAAIRPFPALTLQMAGIGFFPDPRSPRIVWAGVHDAEQRLATLQQVVEAATAKFTSEPAVEKFSGHVTLARIKRIGAREKRLLTSMAATMKDRIFGTWTAREVEILRSELSSEGARHAVVTSLDLSSS